MKKATQYGEFIGKIHSKTYKYIHNLYNSSIPNEEFGKTIAKIIKDNLNNSYNENKESISILFSKIYDEIVNMDISQSVLILLDVDADQYIYDDKENIIGIVDYEAMVIAPKEIELIMWEIYLKDYFNLFLKGYKKFSSYNPKNIQIYKFLVYLLDSMGSDFSFRDINK